MAKGNTASTQRSSFFRGSTAASNNLAFPKVAAAAAVAARVMSTALVEALELPQAVLQPHAEGSH